MSRRVLTAAAALLALVVLPHALVAAPVSTRIEGVDALAFPSIEANVSLFTREALRVPTKDDFVVTEDGKPIGNFDVAVDERPMYVALVLDRSGSMAPVISEVKKAAIAFVRGLVPRAFLRVSTFSDVVDPHGGFTRERTGLHHEILDIRPHGATALHDATWEALHALSAYGGSVRPVALVFTDGRDQNADGSSPRSSHGAKDVALYARERSIPLYYIGLGTDVNRALLAKMAHLTGGEALFTTEAEKLGRLFQGMAQILERSIRLAWTSPRPARDGTLRRVLVRSRLSDREDQGRGVYRAPADPEAAASPPEMAEALPPGEDEAAPSRTKETPRQALLAMLGALGGLGRFDVNAKFGWSGWGFRGNAALPLGADMKLQADLRDVAAPRCRWSWTSHLGGRSLETVLCRAGGRWGWSVGGPGVTVRSHGLASTGGLDLEGSLELALPFLAPGEFGAGADVREKALVRLTGRGATMNLTGDTGLRIRWPDGASMEIAWNARTRLPRTIVRVDGQSGRSLRIDFSDWALAPSTAVDVRIDGAVDGASRAATGRVVMEQLAASGVALRLGAGGLLALSAPNTRIHLDGRGGIELRAAATRLSLRGGELALQDPAMGDALQGDLGGLMRIVASPGWREDGTDWVAFSRTFEEMRRKESEAFAGDARAWAEGLAKGLEERESRFLADGEAFQKGLVDELAKRNRALVAGALWSAHACTEASLKEAMATAGQALDMADRAEERAAEATAAADRAVRGAERASDGTVQGALEGASEALRGADEALEGSRKILEGLGQNLGGGW